MSGCGRIECVGVLRFAQDDTTLQVGGTEAVESEEKGVDGQGHPEADEDVGDEEAGVEEGADAGGEGESRIEGAAVGVAGGRDFAEEAEAEGVDGQQQGEGEQGEGQAGGPVVWAEEVHGGGGQPVHQGGLVEEADAVDVGSDVVVAEEHLAGDLGVDGVDVVEQAGGEEAADVQDEPGEDDERDRARICAAGRRRGEVGLGLELNHVHVRPGVEVRLVSHECGASDLAIGLAVEGSVGDEGLSGGLFEEELVGAEEMVGLVAAVERDEEDFAFAGAPLGEELGGGEEEVLGVGEG